ncbi:MAG TPA: phosphoribosyltransferase family protein [Nitrososphaeraceae archaeon]|nr:phosphoribosyltransferase family protein [Nitrososphaeraceae archaeon]
MQSAIFKNRIDAAEKLAKRLSWLKQDRLKEEKKQQSTIILAIPRGGIIIGDIIASELDAKLDVVVSRKIGAPNNPELAIGAVMPDGSYFINQEIVNMLNISQKYIQIKAHEQVREIDRRLMSYRGRKEYDNKFEDKIVVLVDDGIATGATMLASGQWIKNNQHCKKLVIAVPVAPHEILNDLNQVADDEVIVLHSPLSFEAVGQFYQDFSQVSDNEVKEIMKKYET